MVILLHRHPHIHVGNAVVVKPDADLASLKIIEWEILRRAVALDKIFLPAPG